MSQAILILRWLAALLVAVVVYVVVFAIVAAIWQGLVTEPVATMQFAVLLSTALAVGLGAMVVARAQWLTAAATLWILALLFPLWLILRAAWSGAISAENFTDLAMTVAGGFVGWYALRIVARGRRINRAAGDKG